MCSGAEAGDGGEGEGGEVLLYDNYRPAFANLVLSGAAAHCGFWAWAINMNYKITEIHGQELLNIWYDYAGLGMSALILSLAALWKRRNVAQVAQVDPHTVRIGTYGLLSGIASSTVPIHTLSMHPKGMRGHFMIKMDDDGTFMMVSKKGTIYDHARLMDVLKGRPTGPASRSPDEEQLAQPIQRLQPAGKAGKRKQQ